jgi:D-alanine transaminase
MRIAMIDDALIGYDRLGPVYLDRGLYFGDGVYEVLRSYEGQIFALEEHLGRFARSLREIGLPGVDIDAVRSRVMRGFEEAGFAEAKIYFHMTRGSGDRNHGGGETTKPNFFLTVMECPDSAAAKEKGVAVSTFPDWRWKRCDIKSLNLLANVLAKRDAEKKGCKEAILVNDAGEVTEGSSSAVFVVYDGQVVTRPLGTEILPSITRRFVCEAAENAGAGVAERVYSAADMQGADEVFLAVTTQDIVPVVRFDGKDVGAGRPGEVTKKLIEEFAKMVKK